MAFSLKFQITKKEFTSLQSTCDMLHCLGERSLFLLHLRLFFWWFLPSNTLTMLYNIRHWWFFLSQCNRNLAHPKTWMPKPYLLVFVFFGCFVQLSPDCRFDSRVKWWIHVSSIVTYLCKNFFVAFKQLQTMLWIINVLLLLINCEQICTYFEHSFFIAKWWIHCLMISSTTLLPHITSIYDQPKQVCGVFWCFLGPLPNLGDPSIQHHLCLNDRV